MTSTGRWTDDSGESRRLTGGQALVEALRREGVTHLFGIPGTHTIEIYRALGAAPDIQHITARHEQGAAMMADGYARSTGRPGVCCVITGPGVTNASTGIAQAYSDSVPVVCIAAELPRSETGRRRGHWHELRSQEDVVAGITDRALRLDSPKVIPNAVADAFAAFRVSRPRPIVMTVPIDVQETVEPVVFSPRPAESPPAPDLGLVEQAAVVLARSARPSLLVGGGAISAAAELLEIATRLDAPVASTLNGRGTIPTTHRLSTGLTVAYAAVVRLLEESDVVLAIGTELSPSDLWSVQLHLRGKLIQLDIDPSQIGVNHPVDIALVGDARVGLSMLAQALPHAGDRQGAKRAAAARSAAEDEAMIQGRTYRPWITALRRGMPPGSCLAMDVTMIVGFGVVPYYDLPGPRQWMNPTGLSTLGYALPAAIGAAVASRNRPVAAVTGDGGFMFTMPELMVAVENRLPIPVIVWNDGGYGEIRRHMRERGFEPIGTDQRTPDFSMLARAMGAQAERVTEPAMLTTALDRAFASDGPTLIEIPA